MNSTFDTALPSLADDLANRIDAFELALEYDRDADLARYLPPVGHPLYLAVLEEAIRIDLERGWDSGRRKRVADYTARFPAVLANPPVLAAVAFEEYRQRSLAGERPDREEYRLRYGVATAGWESIAPSVGDEEAERTAAFTPDRDGGGTAVVPDTDLPRGPHDTPPPRARASSAEEAVSQWQASAAALPDVGTEFLGFHLERELGRGAFGRVYLARQGDLAGRPVALKVARGLGGESNTLAQLQHPNVVPIYSYHNAGAFQAVCMPYLGGTTLAQVVQALGQRSGVPSSGKELRSTLARRKVATTAGPASHRTGADSARSDAPPAASPVPLPAAVVPSDGAADGWARLDGLPYVEAILALGGQLADGLAHAHARGILHRDLKPANVLLTDDGRPMLLDFNLAEDTKLRGSAEHAMIGGTIPYMAPEQLTGFFSASGQLDARCDVYGLGVVLFQLLTGRHPFPMRSGPSRTAVAKMLADRATPPPLRVLNPAISPAVESIIQKCLAPELAARYQSADDLREDIDRHLAHRPLKHAADPSVRERARKWARRHPRLTSSGGVAAVAALVLAATVGGVMYARESARGLEARGRLAEHQTAFRDAQSFLDDQTRSAARLDEGLEKLRGVLRGYGVPEDGGDAWESAAALRYLPDADRERVKGDIAEAYFLASQVSLLKATATSDPGTRATLLSAAGTWNRLAERYGTDRLPRAVREQRGRLAELGGDKGEADRLRAEAEKSPPVSARDLYLAGSQHAREGRHRDALRHLQPATRLDPENFSAWFLRGVAHLALDQDELAAMCFGACVSLRPDFAPAWWNRGTAFARLRLRDHAREDFDEAIRLDPKNPEAYLQRADLRETAGDLDGAIADYTAALDTGNATARIYFKRATARFHKKDLDGAAADRAAGFKIVPTDELSWVARSENRLPDDPKAALADAEEALKVNPWSVFGLQMKAAILSEHLNRPADAVKVLDKAVELHPDYVPARAGRGVLLARAGQRDAAHRDATAALRRDTRAPNLYQAGCIYALTAKAHPEDAREAIHLLWGGLKAGFALDIVDTDADLNALRDDANFKAVVKDAKALEALRAGKK